MALFECNFFSESIGMSTSAYVILPQTTTQQIGMEGIGSPDGCPVLYLLHGLSDDHSIWLRRTSIERYAAQYGIAVVMPNGHRSFYSDMKNDMKYWQYLSKELPAFIHSVFKFSTRREDTFAAGLSMGGFGALKLGLNCPDQFAAVAGLSSAVIRPETFLNLLSNRDAEFRNIFGDIHDVTGSVNDLYFQADKDAKAGTLPKIFMACGTEDFLYKENVLFRDHLKKIGADITFMEGPGSHEWGFWDHYIQEILRWLPIKK